MTAVSVVLPTYQEAATVDTAVAVVDELLDTRVESHEIVVVDDSPTLETVDSVRAYARDCPHVRAIHRDDGDGLASAVLAGFDTAEGDILVCMDADLQHPPRRVDNLCIAIEDGADMAIGSRHVDGGGVADDWPLHRQAISWGATALAWGLVPPARDLTDPMSGFFAIRSELVEPVRDQLRPHGYKIALELLARCPVEEVYEVPYTFAARVEGESNLGMREYLRYVKHLTRLSVPSRLPSNQRPAVEQEVADE